MESSTFPGTKNPTWTFQHVALEPFPTRSIEKDTTRTGFSTIKQKHELTPLKVIFPSNDGKFQAGDIAYLMGDQFVQPFAKAIYEIDGNKFILVPLNVIVVLERPLSYTTPYPGDARLAR